METKFKEQITEIILDNYRCNYNVTEPHFTLKRNGDVVAMNNCDDYLIKLTAHDGYAIYYGKLKRTLVLTFETNTRTETVYYYIQQRESGDEPCWWKTIEELKERIYDKYEYNEVHLETHTKYFNRLFLK